jgi:hypothetical protein
MDDPSAWVNTDSGRDISKHHYERATQGFSVYDWWNFNSYLTWVIIGGLEKFKTGAGHPVYGGINSMDDWCEALDKMIAGFTARHELDNDFPGPDDDREAWRATREKAWRVGAELFVKFFPSLWD